MEKTHGGVPNPNPTRTTRSGSSASSSSASNSTASNPASPRRHRSSERPKVTPSPTSSTPSTPPKHQRHGSDQGQKRTPPKDQPPGPVEISKSALEALLDEPNPPLRVHDQKKIDESQKRRDDDVNVFIGSIETKLIDEKDTDKASKMGEAITRLRSNDRTVNSKAANYFRWDPATREDTVAEFNFLRDVIISAYDYVKPATKTRTSNGDLYVIGALTINGLVSRMYYLRRAINAFNDAAAKAKERAERATKQKAAEEQAAKEAKQRAVFEEAQRLAEETRQKLLKINAEEEARRQAAAEAEAKNKEAARLAAAAAAGADQTKRDAAEAARVEAERLAKETQAAADRAAAEQKAQEERLRQDIATKEREKEELRKIQEQQDKAKKAEIEKREAEAAELAYRTQFRIAVNEVVRLATFFVIDFNARAEAYRELTTFGVQLMNATPMERRQDPSFGSLLKLLKELDGYNNDLIEEEKKWSEALRKGAQPADIDQQKSDDAMGFKWGTCAAITNFLQTEEDAIRRADGTAFEDRGKKAEHNSVFDLVKVRTRDMNHERLNKWALALRAIAADHVTATTGQYDKEQRKVADERAELRKRVEARAVGPKHLALMSMATRYLQPPGPRDRPNLVPVAVALLARVKGADNRIPIKRWITMAHKFIGVFARGENRERNYGYAIYLDGSVAVPVRPNHPPIRPDLIVEGSLSIVVMLERDNIGMVFSGRSGIWMNPDGDVDDDDDAAVGSLYRHGEVRTPVDVPKGKRLPEDAPKYHVDEMLLQLASVPDARDVPVIRRILVHRWSTVVAGSDRILAQTLEETQGELGGSRGGTLSLPNSWSDEEEQVDDADLPPLREGDDIDPNAPD